MFRETTTTAELAGSPTPEAADLGVSTAWHPPKSATSSPLLIAWPRCA